MYSFLHSVGYFDLFLVHWPLPGYFTETYRALEDLHKEGKVKSIGLSNFTMEDYTELSKTMTVPPVVNQIEINPLAETHDTGEIIVCDAKIGFDDKAEFRQKENLGISHF